MSDTPKVPVAVLEYEPSGFEQTLLKHKTKLIIVGVLALAGTGGYWGYRLIKEASHKSAAVDFVRARTVPDLKAVAEKHSGKPAAGDALILAAERLSADRPGEAIDLLKDFLNRYPDHPLRGLASFRIAEYFVLSGDNGSAEKEYEAVAKASTAFSAIAQLRLGDMKWAAGDTAKAQEYYDTIQKSSSTSANAVRAIAKERIENDIKAKPPVLVEYVPEPPATTAVPGTPGIDGINLGDLNGPGAGDTGGALLPPAKVPFNPDNPPVPVPVPAPAPPPPVPPVPQPGAESAPPVPPPGSAPVPPPASGTAPKPTPGKANSPSPGSAPKPASTPPPAAEAAPKEPAAPASGDAPKPIAPPVPAPGATPADGKKVP